MIVEAFGIIAVVTFVLWLIACFFGEVCDLLIFWWQKR